MGLGSDDEGCQVRVTEVIRFGLPCRRLRFTQFQISTLSTVKLQA